MAVPTGNVSIIDAAGGGDYSTIATWESSEQRNLVSNNEQEYALISASGALAGTNTIAGWTTDNNHKIIIRPHEPEAFHNGIANTRCASIAGGSYGLYINGVPNVEVHGLHVGSGSTYGIIIRASGCLIKDCIIDGNAGVTNYGIYAFSTNWGGNPSFVYNTVIHGALTGVYMNNNNGSLPCKLPVINCTIDGRTSRALYANGAGARILSENNILEASTIYGTINGGTLIHGFRDVTSDTTAANVALRNIGMASIVVNPDDGVNSRPYDYHLDTTPGATLASGVAGSGLLPMGGTGAGPAGSGNGFDFELDPRPMLDGQFSIGADQWNRGIDRNTGSALFGA